MISGEFHTLAMFLGAFSAKKKLDNYHSWWFADDQDGNHKNLYDEKQNSGGENSTGRKDNQLSELEQLSLLLVLDDPHNQDGHTFQDTARHLVLSQKCYWWFCCFLSLRHEAESMSKKIVHRQEWGRRRNEGVSTSPRSTHHRTWRLRSVFSNIVIILNTC